MNFRSLYSERAQTLVVAFNKSVLKFTHFIVGHCQILNGLVLVFFLHSSLFAWAEPLTNRSPASYEEPAPNPSPAGLSDNLLLPPSLVLFSNSDWKLTLGGFVELDVISDSTRSFNEQTGNAPVSRTDSLAGSSGRSQLSIRNSRLGLNLDVPSLGKWKTKAYIETDFLGFDPSPGVLNSESSFYNNPTLRIRHAFIRGDSEEGLTVLAGQTWNLLGWQPYYFLSAGQIQPVPGMLFGRTSQIRGMKTFDLSAQTQIQAAIAVLRAPQRDSRVPDVQAGLRIAFNGRKSGLTGGCAGPLLPQPMSIGISASHRELTAPGTVGAATTNNYSGDAIAFNLMIPIVASADGKTSDHTLSLASEFVLSRGAGDQYVNWSGNVINPLGSSATQANEVISLDPGIGGYDASGNFSLINLSSVNVQLQYHLPTSWKTWVTVAAAQLYSNNVASFSTNSGLVVSSLVPYYRQQMGLGNISHQFTQQLRGGLEYSRIQTVYADGVLGFNNRYQLTLLFIF